MKAYYLLFRIMLLITSLSFLDATLYAQCGEEDLLIEISLLTGDVCENSEADVTVKVTPESDFPLQDLDSLQWIWYFPLLSVLTETSEETTFPPFDAIPDTVAENSHIYDELINLGCSELSSLIDIQPNIIETSIRAVGYVTCDDGTIEKHGTSTDFNLKLQPRANIDINPSTICINQAASFINTGCFGDSDLSFWTLDGVQIQAGDADVIDYAFSSAGTFEVCLHLENSCGEDIACKNITVVPEPHALFDIPDLLQDGEGCAGEYEFCNISDTINFYNEVYYWGVYFNGNMQGDLDTQFYKNCFEYNFNNPGDYEVVLIADNYACDTVQHRFSFTILESPFATLQDAGSFCETEFTGYTPSVTYNGDILSYSWTFENGAPASSNQAMPSNINFPPGTHDIELEITSACGMQNYQTTITIDSLANINFSPIGDAYCTGQGDTLKINVNPSGGSWSPNVVFNDSCILIDNLPVGPNTLTYTYGAGACNTSADISFDISDITPINFDLLQETYCVDAGIITLTGVSPLGGTWSGNGVIDSLVGTIDPTIIGAGNSSTIGYTFENSDGCISQANKTIIIEGLPNAALPQDTLRLCDIPGAVDLANELGIDLLPGYTDEWIGNCVSTDGMLDPSCLGIGNFTLEYVIFTPNNCTDTTDITIIIDTFQMANAGADLSECVSDGATITLVGTPNGGTWTGTNISADGIITVNSTMEGDYDYTYTFGGANCENQDVVTVSIINLNDISASLSSYCETEGVVQLPDGNPTGGDWIYNGNVLIDNQIDISTLGAGTFELSYQVEESTSSNEVCDASVPVDLFIDALPNPIIQIPEDFCINEPYTIINTTVEQYTSWTWDFGNGTTGSGLTPTVEYSMTGDYTISLTIQDTVCQDVFTWDVHVSSPPPPLAFELTPLSTDSCELLEVAFVNQSQVDPNVTDVIFIWDFGNGIRDTTYSVDEIPDNVFYDAFDADTIYIVTLSALNECGDVIPATATVYVKPKPVSQFSSEFEIYCSGATTNFINSSVGNPENTIINLGDGSPLIYDYPYDTLSHQYFVGDEPQTFIISFISSNPCGKDTILDTIQVVPVEVVAGFTVEGNGVFCENVSFCIEGRATPGSTVWYDMGDGTILYASDTCYIYQDTGSYIITQYAIDICGGLDTNQTVVNVLSAPELQFTAIDNICLGDSITFDLMISDDVVSVEWDFGDGNISNEQNPTHVYTMPGIYTAQVLVSTIETCPSVSSATITVNDLLEVSFTTEDSVCVGESILLTNTTAGTINSCLWTIDESITFSACDSSIVFTTAGTHTLSLLITDERGCQSQLDSTIYIRPTPNAAFNSVLLDNCSPTIYRFINNSQDANTAIWNFGDGTTSAVFDSVEHIYNQAGMYTVSLIVSFDGICFDTMSQQIEILESPLAIVDVLDQDACESFTPVIDNTSTGNNLNYTWTTSNGLSFFDEQISPSFETNQPSEIFTIQLIVTDSITTCADTSSFDITVFDSITLSLVADSVSCFQGDDGQVTANVIGGSPGYQFEWSVPGNTNTISNLNAGAYSLTVTDNNGCFENMTVEVEEPAQIEAGETIQMVTCIGDANGFISVTPIGGTMPYQYNWSTMSTIDSISNLVAGTYELTITDENNCMADFAFELGTANQFPIANISIADTAGCEPFLPIITSTSLGDNLSFEWSYGNGEFAGNQMTITPIYYSDSVLTLYTVDLQVLDTITGCRDSTTQVLTVYDSIAIEIAIDNVDCYGDADGSMTAIVTGGTQQYNYNWSSSLGIADNLIGPAGTYAVSVTDAVSNCVINGMGEIMQPDSIVIILEELQDASCAGLEDGFIEIQASGGTTNTGNEYLYNWNVGGSLSGQSDTLTNIGSGNYTVTVTDELFCSEEASYTIADGYAITVVDTAIGISCEGMDDGQIQIANIIDGVPNFQVFLSGEISDTIFSDAGIFSFKDLAPGSYNLEIVDVNNCKFEDQYMIPSWEDPSVSIISPDTIRRCDSVLVIANATGSNLSYDWFPQVNFICVSQDCDSILVSPEIDVLYDLTVTDDHGCFATAETFIEVDEDRKMYFPNAFTPNGDGINDIFRVRVGAHQASILTTVSKFNVLDRWGNVLFHVKDHHPLDNPGIGWDGTIDGKDAPNDMYIYWAEVIYCNGETDIFKGHIQLIR